MFIRVLIIFISSLTIYFSSTSAHEVSYDMVGYVASAYTEDGFSGAELNKKTVEDIKSSISEREFKEFSERSEIWNIVLTDPESLHQTVPLYSMRIIYIELMRLVHLFGFNYTNASIQVSALFGGLSVLALALIISRVNISIAILPIVVMAANLLDVAKLPSPDSLACFFALLAIYLLMINSEIIFLVAIVMPLARTDLILLSGILMLYLFFNSDKNKFAIVISLCFSIAAFIVANKLHGNYGLLNLFNNHHVHRTPYPADVLISSNPKDYILPYVWLIRDAMSNSQAMIYLVAISIFMYAKQVGCDIKYKYPLFVIPFAYVVLHVMLFPTYYERYFIFSALLILIGILHFLKHGLPRPIAI
jgi:hypothetical protein